MKSLGPMNMMSLGKKNQRLNGNTFVGELGRKVEEAPIRSLQVSQPS